MSERFDDPDSQPTVIRPSAGVRGWIGSTLNDTYEVRRLIASGGMGEVYEGIEINTGERVAIKIVLPHLAADPMMKALFLNEARIMTRLAHPGLVQYRAFTQDRKLGLFYIVMEFVAGPTLATCLTEIRPSAEQLVRFMRRLAAALGAAHDAGLIHRDMSPDNILLPQGELEQAKIIDFGIAKNLAPDAKTIIGSGFAGRMGFCAPEQLAEGPDGESKGVGPWTDVYSLALVGLAVASGTPAPMGSTLREAVEKRYAVPDLSAVPRKLRSAFTAMLQPAPVDRLRSMADVLSALGEAQQAKTITAPDIEERTRTPRRRDAPAIGASQTAALAHFKQANLSSRSSNGVLAWVAGGVSAAILAAGVAAFLWWPTPLKFAQIEEAATGGPSQGTPAADDRAVELAYWQSTQASKTAGPYEAYLEKYPNGVFAALAREKIRELTPQHDTPARNQTKVASASKPNPPASRAQANPASLPNKPSPPDAAPSSSRDIQAKELPAPLPSVTSNDAVPASEGTITRRFEEQPQPIPPPPPPPTPPIALTSHDATGYYPPVSVRLQEQGRVGVEYTINTEGNATECVVTKSSGKPRLDDAACMMISQHWTFRPATEDGKPVAVRISSEVLFILK